MKKHFIRFAAICCAAFITSGCGLLNLPAASDSEESNPLGNLIDIIGSILGSFGDSTDETTIQGTWVYQEPAVQFSSDNLLAKAGGSIASAKVVEELTPYYEKIGIKQGKMAITLNADKTFTYTLGKKTYSGTYEFDNETKTMVLQTTAFNLPTAYVSVSGTQMALTFDSTKLLSMIQTAGALTGNGSSISQISEIAQQYDGMKTGFLFVK